MKKSPQLEISISENSPETLRNKVLQALIENGFDHEPTLDLLGGWTAQMEQEADQSTDRVFALIDLDRKSGRLYFEAGNNENAKYAFENALLQATRENRPELIEAIKAEMKYLGLI